MVVYVRGEPVFERLQGIAGELAVRRIQPAGRSLRIKLAYIPWSLEQKQRAFELAASSLLDESMLREGKLSASLSGKLRAESLFPEWSRPAGSECGCGGSQPCAHVRELSVRLNDLLANHASEAFGVMGVDSQELLQGIRAARATTARRQQIWAQSTTSREQHAETLQQPDGDPSCTNALARRTVPPFWTRDPEPAQLFAPVYHKAQQWAESLLDKGSDR